MQATRLWLRTPCRFAAQRFFHASQNRLASFTSLDPDNLTGKNPYTLKNLVNGKWTETKAYRDIIDPLNGEVIYRVPETSSDELKPFIDSLATCPKTGLHNPFKNVDRYLMLGEVSHNAAQMLWNERHFFARMIQRACPKHYDQALGEVKVTIQFLKNFSGDSVRFMAQDFGVTGDRDGQHSRGYRFPYGPVAVIAPFNFPLEIPALQMMGALYMGNKPVVKPDSNVSSVFEMFMRLLHDCGLPLSDVDVLNGSGARTQELIERSNIRLTQFTGSAAVAEKLARLTGGRVRLEDAGFDWKILGPDCPSDPALVDYVAWQSDQDAYASSGQKCSAQSICFVHENWEHAGFYSKIKKLAERRSLSDLSVGPVLSLTTSYILDHTEKLLKIPGSKLLFGGKELTGHTIPKVYGAVEPTAVFVPLSEMLKEANFGLATTEVFAPFQVVTSYTSAELPLVLEACERMNHHLTAGIVSNDVNFVRKVLANTVNGTTYTGIRARTTGAPQNHWFGPAGDPRGAGIGSREAIRMVWSCHREVIEDTDTNVKAWQLPKAS